MNGNMDVEEFVPNVVAGMTLVTTFGTNSSTPNTPLLHDYACGRNLFCTHRPAGIAHEVIGPSTSATLLFQPLVE
jgi:hypothetical protein